MINCVAEKILVIAGFSLLMQSNCKHPIGCGQQSGYSFLANAEWSPQKEVYQVGDTLYLTSIVPKTLTDQINTSLIIDYSNSGGIVGDLSTIYLDSVSKQPIPAKDSFGFVPVTGSFVERPGNTQSGINIKYSETSQSYILKCGILLRKKGLYGFGLSNLLSSGLRGKDCTKATFTVTVTNSDKHLQLWQNALGVTFNADDMRTGYAFRVR